MKNTRKKMLLSSIAMLLVALIALGSATFAWFTANPNATASGMKLKTTAAAGLVVRTESDSTWSHAAKFYNGKSDYFNLNPASMEQTGDTTPGKLWKVDASTAGAYGHDSSATMSAAQGTTYDESTDTWSTGKDYFVEKVYFRLSDGSDASANSSQKVYISNVTINPNANATMAGTIRVAIVNKEGTLLGTWALAGNDANGTLTTAAKTTGSFDPALATSVASNVDTAQTSLTASGSDLNKYVSVYVYLDGQDGECYSDKVGTVNASAIIDSISVGFTLA